MKGPPKDCAHGSGRNWLWPAAGPCSELPFALKLLGVVPLRERLELTKHRASSFMAKRLSGVVFVAAISSACGGAAPPPPAPAATERPAPITLVRDAAVLPLDLGTLRQPTTVLDVEERRLLGTGAYFASIASSGEYKLFDVASTPLRKVAQGRLPPGMKADDVEAVAASEVLTVFASKEEYVLLRTESGAEMFRSPMPKRASTVQVVDDAALILAAEGSVTELFAIGAEGKERWRQTFQGQFSLLQASSTVLAGYLARGDALDLIELSVADGKIIKLGENVIPGQKMRRVDHAAGRTVVSTESPSSKSGMTVFDERQRTLWSAKPRGLAITGVAGVLWSTRIGELGLHDLKTGELEWTISHEVGWTPIGMVASSDTVGVYLRGGGLHVVVLVDRESGEVREVLDASRPDVVGPHVVRSGNRLVDVLTAAAPRRESVSLEVDLAAYLPQTRDKKSEGSARLSRLGTRRVNALGPKIMPFAMPEGLRQWRSFDRELVKQRLVDLAGTAMSAKDANAYGTLLRPAMLSSDAAEASEAISAAAKTIDTLLEQPPSNESHVAIAHLLAAFVGQTRGAGGAVELPRARVAKWLAKLEARLPKSQAALSEQSLDLAGWGAVRVARASVREPGLAKALIASLDRLGVPPLGLLTAAATGGPKRLAKSEDGTVNVYTATVAGICALLARRDEGPPLFLSEIDRCELKELSVTYSDRALSITFLDGKERRSMGWRWADVLEDQDSDGWSDALEQLVGTNPKSVDSDGDQIPDTVDAAPSCASTSAPDAAARRAVMLEGSYSSAPGSAFMSSADCVSYSSLARRVFHLPPARLEGVGVLGAALRYETIGTPLPTLPAITAWFSVDWPESRRRLSVTTRGNAVRWEVANLHGRWFAVRSR